jgi:hypothetical protein
VLQECLSAYERAGDIWVGDVREILTQHEGRNVPATRFHAPDIPVSPDPHGHLLPLDAVHAALEAFLRGGVAAARAGHLADAASMFRRALEFGKEVGEPRTRSHASVRVRERTRVREKEFLDAASAREGVCWRGERKRRSLLARRAQEKEFVGAASTREGVCWRARPLLPPAWLAQVLF